MKDKIKAKLLNTCKEKIAALKRIHQREEKCVWKPKEHRSDCRDLWLWCGSCGFDESKMVGIGFDFDPQTEYKFVYCPYCGCKVEWEIPED